MHYRYMIYSYTPLNCLILLGMMVGGVVPEFVHGGVVHTQQIAWNRYKTAAIQIRWPGWAGQALLSCILVKPAEWIQPVIMPQRVSCA